MSSQLKLPPLVVVLGPTASGKSSLAVALAQKFNGEIVNADSRTSYADMTIGTACPVWDAPPETNLKMHGGIAHHLFQITKPTELFSVQAYKQLAVPTIFAINEHGKLPFLVGGTGLYIKAIVDNLEIPRVPPQPEIRHELEARLINQGLASLWKELIQKDPGAKKTVQPKNPRRVIRALEVIYASGLPFSSLQRQGKPFFNTLQLGLSVPRAELYQRIDERTETMFAHGLVAEVKHLLKIYGSEPTPFHGLIYQPVLDYIEHKITLAEAKTKAKFTQHAFARRQMTWFRKDKRIKWIETQKEAEEEIKKFLTSTLS